MSRLSLNDSLGTQEDNLQWTSQCCSSNFSHLFLLSSVVPLLAPSNSFFAAAWFVSSLFSSPLLLSPTVPIRRNLIGNQSFWGKNGVGLSITVPWVLPAERGVQKRLYTGTVAGKVNVADSLSLALFQKMSSLFFFSDTLFLLAFFLQVQNTHMLFWDA